VGSILISHKKSNKVLTKNRKGFSVRGQLHKEFIFGRRQAPQQEEGYHRRIKITELENNKHISKVVDLRIRELILKYLEEKCGVNINNPKGFNIPKDAFIKDGQARLFLPNKNGDPVPIKKIRIKEALGKAAKLKSDINQWVNPRNNHHVLIYKDFNGNLKEDVVQFWTVAERILQGIEIYQLPEDGKEIVTTLEINDMFLLGLSDEEYLFNINNLGVLAQNLYRVQKISSVDYTFRFHVASTVFKSKG
jgi:CRISPR-associated endonuclease Csn1